MESQALASQPNQSIPAQAGIDSMEQFCEKRKLWIEWLTEDEHSIQSQIDEMVYNHFVYKGLRFKPKGKAGIHSLPSAVNYYLDMSYPINQMMAIRRLYEEPNRNDYISVNRLLTDIKNNIHLFTRENFVCFDGKPFDPMPDKLEHEKKVFEEWQQTKDVVCSSIQPFYISEYRHNTFDKLLTVIDANYKPTGLATECLNAALINKLISHIGGCSKIETIASKYHAHASDKKNRESVPENEKNITFSYIEKCHSALYKVANFVGSELLAGEPVCIAYPQYAVFEGFDESVVDCMEFEFRNGLEKFRSQKLF